MSAAASHRASFSIAWRSRPRDSAAPAALNRADVLWIEVETGLWVGRVEGEFTGMIELTTTGFVATDGRGRTAGLHPSLAGAKRALAGPRGARAAWRRAAKG